MAIGARRGKHSLVPRTRTLTIWCTEEQIETLDRLAAERGICRALLARNLLNVGFRQLPADEQVTA